MVKKHIIRLLLVLTIILVFSLGIGWHLLKSDHPYVISKIQEVALERWNADLLIEEYQLEWVKPFPTIRFHCQGLRFASSNDSGHPIIQSNKFVSDLSPYILTPWNIKADHLHFDSLWIHIYKDSLDNSNLSFNKDSSANRSANKDVDQSFSFADFPHIKMNYLDFHHQNDYRRKWQRAQLKDATLQSQPDNQGEWSLHLQSDCFFDGLVFNENDGSFLANTPGELDLHFSLAEQGQKILLDTGYLEVAQKKYFLKGSFHRATTDRLQLQIATKGIRIPEVSPLLSNGIVKVIEEIKIDRPIRAQFYMDKYMIPGTIGLIKVEFSTDSAHLHFRELDMTSLTLRGDYSNNSKHDGLADPVNSRITIEQLDGDFFGVIPTQLNGVIDHLKDPRVNALGRVDMHLPALNSMLSENKKLTFVDGTVLMDFEYTGRMVDIIQSPFDEEKIKMCGIALCENIGLNIKSRKEPLPLLSAQLSFDDKETLLEELSLSWMGSNINLSGRLNNLPEFLFYGDQALKSNLRIHFDQLDLNKFIDKGNGDVAKRDKDVNVKNSKAPDYRQLEVIAQNITSNINGEIDLDIDKLIYGSLYFTDIKTHFRLFSPRRAEYVDSSMIRLDKLTANFMGDEPMAINFRFPQDSIQEAVLDIKLESVVPFVNKFFKKQMYVTEGKASMELTARAPLRSLFQTNNLLSALRYEGEIIFNQLEAEVEAFTWPVKMLSGPFVFDSDQVVFDDLQFQYRGSPFQLNGRIDDYAIFRKDKKNKATIDLHLRGNYLNRKNSQQPTAAVSTSPPPTASQMFRSLDTLFHFASGKIDLRLDSILTTNHIIKPFILKAQLVSDDLNPAVHQLKVDSFNFGFGYKNNVRGSAQVTNPAQPQIAAQLQARMKFKDLGTLLPSEYMKMEKGYFKLDLTYQSLLYDTIDAKSYFLNAAVDGTAELVNGRLFYNYRDFTFDNINGLFTFDQSALSIQDLNLNINNNPVRAHGQSSYFFPFFILPDQRAHIELDVTSPYFDFSSFTAPHGLGKDTIISMENTVISNVDTTANALSKTAGFIDQLLDRGSLDLTTDIKELGYREFTGSNLRGNISLAPDSVQLNNIKMDLAEGTFAVDGSITNVVHHAPKMKFNVKLKQNDIREVFRQFENFGQAQLIYENLEGSASADIQFKANVNSNYAILPETMHGDMDVKLIGGQLINVNALKKLTGFFFRKRRLDHVLIDTLQTFTHIRGSDLYIDKFYLHSSSFDFGVEGVYSLGAENKTRILFAIPISNLFRKHLTKKELKSGKSKRKGMKIFIEARERRGRMRFVWKLPIFGREKYRLP